MKYGYARVSTAEQDVSLQTSALEEAGCSEVFVDQGVSGAERDRPALTELLEKLEAGDHLVVWRLDRLGRSLPHLVQIVTELAERGVEFRSLRESIDTASAGGRLIFHVMAALAEFERDLIAERTTAGMASAKARGIHVGRPRAMSAERVRHARELLGEGKSLREVGRLLKVSPSTLYRHVRQG